MVEPSETLQLVFEKAIKDAKKLKHEYVTLEHLLFSMMCEENFYNIIKGLEIDPDYLKSNLEHYLTNKLGDIKTEESKYKPKKTQTVERVLNRAFTQVLFNGRPYIELTDVLLSILAEKKSMANYYLEESGISKDNFAEYLNSEVDEVVEQEETSGAGQKALKQYTTNLNEEVKNNKVDPVIGRDGELESIALALGRRSRITC